MATTVPQTSEEARERGKLQAARRKLATALDDPERLGHVTPRRAFVVPLRRRPRLFASGILFPAVATACAIFVRRYRKRAMRVRLARRLALGGALLGGAVLSALGIVTATRVRRLTE